MENTNEVKNTEIKKDQLLSEGNFIYYCNDSNNRAVTMTGKFHRYVDENFLRAMEKDGFLKPLLIVEESVRKQNGQSEKIEPVHYYSPFQIFIALQLSHNAIDEQGLLRSPNSLNGQQPNTERYISWGYGGAGSILESQMKKEKNAWGGPGELTFCNYLYDFLSMLHTFNSADRYSDGWKREKGRYYTGSPEFQFNFDRLKIDKTKLLDQFGLNTEKLEALRSNIGQTALIIDPLEKWYPFLQRLPQWRKDELKGEALLAQDLYGLCEIIADVLEAVTTIRPQDLLEITRRNSLVPDNKQNEYAHGTDIEAIKSAVLKFKDWLANEVNTKILVSVLDEIGDKYKNRIESIEKELKDFENRYSKYQAGRYVNIHGRLVSNIDRTKMITTAELDDKTKRIAEQMIEQTRNIKGMYNSEEEMEQGEIRDAIRSRLGDIQQDFINLIYEIERPLSSKKWQLESEKENGRHNGSWFVEYIRSIDAPKNNDNGNAYIQFHEKFLPKKLEESEKKIEPIKTAVHTLGGFIDLVRLVFCAHCRKNPVLLHQAHNDKRLSTDAVCDSCVTDKKRSPDTLRGSEWRCPRCDRVIYKFVNGNVLSARTQTKFPVVIELRYGQLEVEAYCPDCKIYIPETIDWGWLS